MLDFLYINIDNKPYLRIGSFILFFYFSYLIVSFFGTFIIDYDSLSFHALFLYIFFVFCLFLGSELGFAYPGIFIKKIYLNDKKIRILNAALLSVLSFIIVIIWYLYSRHFGSIENIFKNAYNIRAQLVGKGIDIVPVFLTYLISFVYALFCIILAGLGEKKQIKPVHMIYPVVAFLIITLSDLTTFGRVGILFAIFSIIGFFILFKRKLFSFKGLFSLILLFFVLSIPRLIRGGFDNFEETVKGIKAYYLVEIPAFLNSAISVFTYYFSSLFALSSISDLPMDPSNGKRLLAPLVNIISRFSGDYDRFSLIEPFAYIPFGYNIFTIIKDILNDFGFAGLIVVSMLFGLLMGWIFRSQNTIFNNALKLFFISWLFFTPLYNLLSFGAFFISFLFLLFMSLFFTNVKEERFSS